MRYKRNMIGYGQNIPKVKWPNNAYIAVQFVLNYEEGGENCLLHNDAESEAFLSEIPAATPWKGQRHWNMESCYEYGARAGFWRLHTLFAQRQIPVTIYGVATALARSPEHVAAMQKAEWEIASHGFKWIDYRNFTRQQEYDHIQRAKALHYQVTGEKPRGWYTGRCSINTVDLIAEDGSFDYVSDSYADDLPYWHKQQLVIPYTLDANDMRFSTPQGFNSGAQFYTYLKDSFDVLYAEGVAGVAKMMSIGLHCRIIGRPGRVQSLRRFIEYAQSHDRVWFAKRIDIARYWCKHHPPAKDAIVPTMLDREAFIVAYGEIFEHSPWIAAKAWVGELGTAHNSAIGLHNALTRVFRASDEASKLRVLKAHPALAGKLAQEKCLGINSAAEQAKAGLDVLTVAEYAEFSQLNIDYQQKFGFPFIIAVKDYTKDSILSAFRKRLNNDRGAEFAMACAQVERIALLRLQELLG